METLPRYRRGDTSPLRPGLVFWGYSNAGKNERWFTPEKFDLFKIGRRNWFANYSKRCKPKWSTKPPKRYARGDSSPLHPGMLFWGIHRGKERWVTVTRFNDMRRIKNKWCREVDQSRKTENWRSKNNTYIRKRFAANLELRIARNIRSAVYGGLNGRRKTSRTEEIIGCTFSEFGAHLEKQFEEGMTWNNWGHKGWEIDHRVPIAFFNLNDPEQQKLAFSFHNCRPLWKSANAAKSDKIEGELFRGRELRKMGIIPFQAIA